MNKKTLFLVITLTTMLILVTSVNAATDNTNTSTTHSISEKTTTTEPVVKEKIENTPTKQKTDKTQDKTITKTNKRKENIKTTTKTIEVSDTTTLINAFDEINSDIENDNYIITLKEGDYTPQSSTTNVVNKNVTIEGNGNNLKNGMRIYWRFQFPNLILNNIRATYILNDGNMTINNSIITNQVGNTGNVTIINSQTEGFNNQKTMILNNTVVTAQTRSLRNSGTLIIDGGNVPDESLYVVNTGEIIVIESDPNQLIENENITREKIISSKENITLINCQINAKITNQGNITLVNCSLSNNNIDYMSDIITEKRNDGLLLANNGNSFLINCSIENNIFNDTYTPEPSTPRVNLIGAISNKGNMTVDNCTFRNNSVGYRYHVNDGSYFGIDHFIGDASCIYNIGNLSIKESLFENNYAGKDGAAILSTQITQITYDEEGYYNGTIVLNDGNIIIDNTAFTNNTAATTGITLSITGSNNLIENSTITDTINAKNLILKNNTINTAAITITNNLTLTSNNINRFITAYNIIAKNNTLQNGTLTVIASAEITNNTFTTQSSILLNDPPNCNIHDNTYLNASIGDQLSLNIPNKIYAGEPLTITGTYTINTPEYYDSDILDQNKFQLYINDELNQISDTLEFTITPTDGTLRLTVQPTISQTRKTEVIRATTLGDLIITPENYNEYIYEGALLGVSKDTKILFQGTFTDKGEIFIDTEDIILDGSNATFTNTIFKLEATGITLQNMKINNTQTQYPIQNTKDNNIITGNTITLTNTEGKTAAIYNKASNTEITYNTLYIDGPATDIDHSEGYGIANTQAILLIGGDKNKVEYNTVTVTTTGTSTQFGTTEAITNHKEATNTIISNNNITLTGNANFKYGINSLNNVENITITNNNIQVTGERYTDGIQIGTGANNILIQSNNIKCICQNTTPVDEEAITYGITTVTVGGVISNNITVKDNNIDLTGTANYGIELYTTNNTLVENNTINVNGPQSMGIGLAHSQNSTIIGNYIKTSGDSTIPLGTVTEEIQPANVGIQIQQDSDNILIEDNTIQTYDKAGKDNCINITTNNVTVKNNNLTSSTQTGENTITTTQPDTIIDNNNAIEQESTTQTTTEDITLGESTALTAQFYDDTYTPVSGGKAIFRVNGKTLRDNQGNVIYADVINGRAELPDVNITQEWTKEDTTIQAIYIGDDNNDPITTTPTTINVTKPEATITIDAPTEATAGTTITLKATVTDGENNINSGRVAFKLNGKTLKDPKTGKALYANVENGIATIQYTIPEKTKAKTYNLTAVFTDSMYDRKEASAELVVAKA